MACLLGYVGVDNDWKARLARVLPDAAWHDRDGVTAPGRGLWWSGPAGGGFVAEDSGRLAGAIGAGLDPISIPAMSAVDGANLFELAHGAIVLDSRGARLIRDPVGTVPLYSRDLGTSVVVGSSALALARVAPCAPFDWEGVAEFLTFGQLLGTRTLYDGVAAVPAGTTWLVAPGRRDALDPSFPDWRAGPGDRDERADVLDAALRRSVSLIAPSGVEAVFLSGGLDSRYVASLLRDDDRLVRAYTFGAESSADMRVARRVADRLGLDHVTAPTEPADLAAALEGAIRACDGMVGANHLHGSELLPRVRDACSVVWNGFAGDAILGGSFSNPRYRGSAHLANSLYRGMGGGATNIDICSLLRRDVGGHPRRAIKDALAEIGEAEPRVRAYRFLMRERVGRLAAVGLAVDRHFLPVACPFANGPVVEELHLLSNDERAGSAALRRALFRNHGGAARETWPRTGLSPTAPAWLGLAGRVVQRLRDGDQSVNYTGWMGREWSTVRSDLIRRLAEVDGFNSDAILRRAHQRATRDRLPVDAALMTLGVVSAALEG